jgi:MoaA/NifB/PqqE/SkfB family radical SAM enzyme
MDVRRVVNVWGKILVGNAPLLSIEITRECPLHCPGCYAYGDDHLGGGVTLRELSDLRGDDLVRGVVDVVRRHQPLQVSIVGGEPLVRHRELSRILPELNSMGVYTLVVTSAVIKIPKEWMEIPMVRVAVSIDGLREDHDNRRAPATYDRILKNIEGCRVDISWVVTHPQMRRSSYLDEYLSFWSSRPEIDRIWLSTYTPQIGEKGEEMLTREDRQELILRLPELKLKYPALVLIEGMEQAINAPPPNHEECMFSKTNAVASA